MAAERKIKIIYVALALLVIAFAVAGMSEDRFRLIQNGQDMAGPNAVIQSTSVITGTSPKDAAGILTESTPVGLRAGSYQVLIYYSAEAEGNYVTLEGGGGAAASGQPYMLREPLPPGQGYASHTFSFTLDEATDPLVLTTFYGGEGSFSVHSVQLDSANPLYFTDHLMLAAALLLLALFGYWRLFKRRFGLGETVQGRLARLGPVLFTIFLTALVCYPVFVNLVTLGHDTAFHLLRIESIAAAFRGGQLPPRLYSLFFGELGYAAPVFYPDFFLWPSAILRVLGVSLTGVYQFLLFAISLATVAIALWVGRRLLRGRWPAYVFCTLYATALYRSTNVFVRGAIGEALAMAFLPLAVYGLYEVLLGRLRRWPFAALGYLCVLLSHTISFTILVALTALLALVFIGRLVRQRARLWALLKAAGLAAALGLFFLLPFATLSLSLNLPGFTGESMWQYAVQPGQLFNTHAGYGAALGADSLAGKPPYIPGLPLLICGFGMAAALILGKRKDARRLRRIGGLLLALSALFVVLSTTLVPWRIIGLVPVVTKLAGMLQFPWRFMSFACLFLALCGGVLAMMFRPSKRLVIPAVGAVLAVCFIPLSTLLDSVMTHPSGTARTDSVYPYTQLVCDTFYTPVASDQVVAWVENPPGVTADTASFTPLGWRQKNSISTLQYTSDGVAWIDLPLLWYPGYAAQDEAGNTLVNAASPEGLVRVYPQSAQGTLTVRYTGLWWWRIGDIISLVTLVGCIAWPLWRRRRQKAT